MEYRRLFDEAREIAVEHYDFCRKIILDEVPEFLKNDSHQIDHACAAIYHMRGAVLEEALKIGYITYSDNDSRNFIHPIYTVKYRPKIIRRKKTGSFILPVYLQLGKSILLLV